MKPGNEVRLDLMYVGSSSPNYDKTIHVDTVFSKSLKYTNSFLVQYYRMNIVRLALAILALCISRLCIFITVVQLYSVMIYVLICRYGFDYGCIHFVMMSTEHNFTQGSVQYIYLVNHLKTVNRTKTPWLIFSGHRYRRDCQIVIILHTSLQSSVQDITL